MNKGIVKLELIADWIFLIIWLTWGLFMYLLSFDTLITDIQEKYVFVAYIINIIEFIFYISIVGVLVKSLRDTKKTLYTAETVQPTNKSNILMLTIFIIDIIFSIIWLTIGYTLFTYSILFTIPNEIELITSSNALNFLVSSVIIIIIYYGVTYAFINSPRGLRLLCSKPET